jgi:phenylalanyl-tRNA synthetase beta chain
VAQGCSLLPVVNVTTSLLNKFFPGKDLAELIDFLPYIGLDIEGIDQEVLRVEYNPNRPDFASAYGIVRALKGILGIETGIPKFRLFMNSIYKINVESSVKQVRPIIVSLVAKKSDVHDNDAIKQLISMQEDLHDGIGRRRKKASIGIHDLDSIKFPITYKTVSDDFSFVPLGELSSNTIKQILNEFDIGRQYKHILENSNRYPIIVDGANNVLSFPPIINGNVTKVTPETNNLFIEITANNQKAADDILAILAITFHDIGFEIHSVSINSSGLIHVTPRMDTLSIDVGVGYINSMLGLELTKNDIVCFLKKSRLDAYPADKDIITCIIPRYRTDILHAIDIVEEVAIGYGIYNLKPRMSAWTSIGQKSSLSIYFDIIRRTLAGLNMLEVVNFSLVNKKNQYDLIGLKTPDNILSVDATKSRDHELLRASMIPSLLQSLSHNVHWQYPQRLFEIGKIFHLDNTIKESWCLAAVIAHNNTDFTEIKSIMQTFLKITFNKDKEIFTQENANPFFIEGRSAKVVLDKKSVIGMIGEITPLAIDNFKIRVPVSAFELNLSQLLGI